MNDSPENCSQQPEVVTDVISLSAAAAMSATLDYAKGPLEGDPLPALWHWIYFWSPVRQSSIGSDGHPEKGGFLPDLGLPRRMAAGGRIEFRGSLEIGKAATRTSQVTSVQRKEGRSGKLAFVTVAHTIRSEGKTVIYEEQDIVYREAAALGARPLESERAPANHVWERGMDSDEVFLFRYSALTFNGHRIHYDKPFARDVSGYPDLVVHGPLIATLLADLVSRNLPSRTISNFRYRAVRPTFLGNSFRVCGKPSTDGKSVDLWAKDHEGWLTMSADAVLSSPTASQIAD